MDITIRIFLYIYKTFPYSASSNIWEGGNDVDELTIEAFEIEDKEDLIDEIMNKYGQEVLQLVYSYVNNKEVAEDSRLASAVMSLPIKYREVIYLFYYEELSIKEIAMVIDVKENTIKTRLKKAKELLKKGLEG